MAEETPTEEHTSERQSMRAEQRETARRDQFERQRRRMERRETLRQERFERRRNRRPSLFWPMILIGAGALWLLANLEIISGENLSVLLRLWPLIFIVIGLDILVGRESPLLSSLIGLATVGLVMALVIVGPSLGLARNDAANFFGVPLDLSGNVEVKSDTFSAPLGDADSAQVNLDLSVWPTTVETVSDPDLLIDADLDYVGDIRFDVDEGREADVSLGEENFRFSLGPALDYGDYAWQIGLSPGVPLDLTIDVGAGPAELDLSEFDLTALDVEGGAGPVRDLSLPDGEYSMQLDVGAGPVTAALADGAQVALDVEGGAGPLTLGVGDDADVTMNADVSAGPFTLNVGDDADLSLDIDGGAGPITLDVPNDAAVRVVVHSAGAGPVSLTDRFDQVDNLNDDERKTGIWETEGFDRADHQIVIEVGSLGSGPFTVR